MLFNSFHFVCFFLILTPLYFLLPHRFRWFLLLSASCYFYMAFIPVYILILGFTIVVDYFAGILLEETKAKKRRFYLIASLVANIGVLAVFKYYNFLNENLTTLLGTFQLENPVPYLGILLPIGLSFHTFQAMSYTIEVYKGNRKAERHFGMYSLYVMYYPQLVAGPIERPQNLLPQLHKEHYFDYTRVTDGLRLMLWGFVKKMVIADRLAIYVNEVYNNPGLYEGFPLIWATIFFAFQIYCDFSGYSDIAIGASRVMGINLMENFRMPYLSSSIREFWSRWHISLSSWFKSYLYIPLGGNRVVKWRQYYNLMLVFALSGLWHGANWTFILWGFLHGFYLVFALILAANFKSISAFFRNIKLAGFYKVLAVLFTFFLVLISWVFFRANNITDAFYIIRSSVNLSSSGFIGVPLISKYFFTLSFVLIAFLMISEPLKFFTGKSGSSFANYFKVVFMLLLIYLLGIFEQQEFIYFQF